MSLAPVSPGEFVRLSAGAVTLRQARLLDPETRALGAGPFRWRARHAAPARRVSVGVQTDALRELTDVLLGGEELTEERARALLNLAAPHFGRERVVALAREFLARA